MIERYFMDAEDPFVQVTATPDKNGAWVNYDDHAAEIAKARKVIEKMRFQILASMMFTRDYDYSENTRLCDAIAEQWLNETEEVTG